MCMCWLNVQSVHLIAYGGMYSSLSVDCRGHSEDKTVDRLDSKTT